MSWNWRSPKFVPWEETQDRWVWQWIAVPLEAALRAFWKMPLVDRTTGSPLDPIEAAVSRRDGGVDLQEDYEDNARAC